MQTVLESQHSFFPVGPTYEIVTLFLCNIYTPEGSLSLQEADHSCFGEHSHTGICSDIPHFMSSIKLGAEIDSSSNQIRSAMNKIWHDSEKKINLLNPTREESFAYQGPPFYFGSFGTIVQIVLVLLSQ